MAPEQNSLDELRIHRPSGASTGSRRGIWIALVFLLIAGGIAAYWLTRPKVTPVRAAAARAEEKATAGAVLNASGYVTARRQATVSSKVTGKVVEILVEEGMQIREGQVLARLDDSVPQKQLALAKAQLEAERRTLAEIEVRKREAELNRGRMKRLLEQGVTTTAQLDTAEAEVDSLAARLALGRQQISVAERQLALQQQDLEDTVIRAPFSGVAISKDAQPGEMISPVSAGGGFTRTGICTIVDMGSLEIEVDVNESYINRVKPGQKAVATLDSYPDWQIPSTVIMPVPTADRQKATVKVRLGFDQLGDPRILPDMGIKVAFLGENDGTGEAAAAAPDKPAVKIPRAALRKDGDREVVLVIVGDHVERRAVGVSPAPGNEAVVLSGLAAGEKVVIEGPAELKDGDKVEVRD